MPTAEPETPGFELPLLLFGGFRALIDALHAELAAQGHPGMRPAHGFAMQAIGLDGATASEVGRLLGISRKPPGRRSTGWSNSATPNMPGWFGTRATDGRG